MRPAYEFRRGFCTLVLFIILVILIFSLCQCTIYNENTKVQNPRRNSALHHALSHIEQPHYYHNTCVRGRSRRGTLSKMVSFIVVSAPDPHVTPSRKRVWYLTSEFLVVLSQHVRKTANPIRSLDLKLSCDKKVVPHGTRMRGRADRI